MKWLIWNKSTDEFWNDEDEDWSNRYYATIYTQEELENTFIEYKFYGSGDLILAVVFISG